MEVKATAVIPTYSNDAGLELVVGQLAEAKILVVIVDNKPNSDKRKLAEAVGAVYLPQKKNLGFARAVNVGVKEAKTEWVMILNDDIELATSYRRQATGSKNLNNTIISQLIEKSRNENWVAVSPVLVKPPAHRHPDPDPLAGGEGEGSHSYQNQVENIGYTVLPIGKVELNFDRSKNTSEYLDGLTAACLLIKREVFLELGGFDESFFAYLEDVDLFLRLKEKGYGFGVATEIEVIHRHQQTSKQFPKKKAYLDMVNWWRVVIKHPIKFILSPTLSRMLVERGRNVSGYLRAMLK